MVRTLLKAIQRREDSLALGTAVGIVTVAVLTLVVGTAAPASVRMSRRVIAPNVQVLPVEPPAPKPAVVKRVSAPAGHPCPQMNNPGGLRWQPAPDAGPWSTGGAVSLPRFGVSAPIVKVGVNTANEMVVPPNARDVAWLDQGAFPGDTNNAVLAGHINYSGVLGSFGRLQQMRPGDIVVVELDGKRWEFQVVWTCLFDYQTHLAEQIMGRTNVPSVTLISCGGVFQRGAGTHNKRVAVRAELLRAV